METQEEIKAPPSESVKEPQPMEEEKKKESTKAKKRRLKAEKRAEKKKRVLVTEEGLAKLSKEDLITFILDHKEELNLQPRKAFPELPDFSKYEIINVAFLLAYCGHDYQTNTRQTIESKLFDALRITCLIEDWHTCGYTRCGRTDAGVSALGNVVSVWIRKIPMKKKEDEFDDYCRVVNHKLPTNIRVLGWSPVSYSFNARYACLYREYLYYFVEEDLDVEKMRVAAQRFVGTHDFSNFCKKDIKENQSYTRNVFRCEIRKVKADAQKPQLSIYAFYIRGSSFLWHQVRCLMGVLFLIGRGEKDLDYVDFLFDLQNYPTASERPLILYNCGFEDVVFRNNFVGSLEVYDKMKSMCIDKVLDYCIYNTIWEYFDSLVYSSAQFVREVPEVPALPGKIVTWSRAMELANEKRKASRDIKKATPRAEREGKKKTKRCKDKNQGKAVEEEKE